MNEWFAAIAGAKCKTHALTFTCHSMKMSTRRTIVQFIAAALIFLFAYTAVSKLFNFRVFQFTLGLAPVISPYARIASIVIPSVNLLAVILLLIPPARRWGLCFSLFLLSAYTAYIGYVLLTAKELPCTCNGIVPWLSWTNHFWLNLIILLLIFISLRLSKRVIAINQPALADAGNRQSRKPV